MYTIRKGGVELWLLTQTILYPSRRPTRIFSRVARMVDENGAAVILKNNVPRYVLMEFSQVEDEQQAKDEDILEISKRLISKNKQAYEVLAK